MKAKRKLKGRAGFSLAETMLAVLILLLVSGIVATGIPAARNAYEKVIVAANAQVLLSTTATALRDELGTAWNVEKIGDTELKYYSSDTGALSRLYIKGNDGIWLQEYTSVTGFNVDPDNSVGKERRLISEAAATKDLTITFDSVSCENGVVTISNLAAKKGDSALASVASLQIPVISAKPAAATTP